MKQSHSLESLISFVRGVEGKSANNLQFDC